MGTKTNTPDHLLVSSTLGLIGGLLLVVAGREIMDALSANVYTTVFGLEIIDSSLMWIGVTVIVTSILGIVIGIWRNVR